MSRISWNDLGSRKFETGLDRGVLYPIGAPGVPWNGLISIAESSVGGDVESYYFDGVKYLDVITGEDFQVTLEALDSPPEFGPCDGIVALAPGLLATGQPRRRFDFSYRTLIGNDTDLLRHGSKIHLVWNCMAAPSGTTNSTIGDTVTPGTKSWTISSVPPGSDGYKPTSHLIIDTRFVDEIIMAEVEKKIYGDPVEIPGNPYLPTQEWLIETLTSGP